MAYTGDDKIVSSSYLYRMLQKLYTKIKNLIDNKADKTHGHDYLPCSGGTIYCDSDNSTYAKAALNIWNATGASGEIHPSISLIQTNVCDSNIVMIDRKFYRKTSTDDTYYKIYDEGTFDRIQSGTTGLVDGVSELKTNYIYIQY